MSLTPVHKPLGALLETQVPTAEWTWVSSKATAPAMEIMTAFVATPRFISRQPVRYTTEQALELADAFPGFTVEGWSSVRLARVWLLTGLNSDQKTSYVRHVETLFDTAEMNELVALYSALPLLAYPEHWRFRATEGVRSNVGDVFDALVMNNLYPAKHFDEAAWNQLVLKTIFNDKPIHKIAGLAERANGKLAHMISDFAHERWAAGRTVAPEVWRLTSDYLDDTLLSDMEHLFKSQNVYDRQAAALTCAHSGAASAEALLSHYPELAHQIAHKKLSWADLEFNDLTTYATAP